MIEITRPGKYSLMIENPVMIASGMMGFDPMVYRSLLKIEKLGAIVTSAVSLRPRGSARGPRLVNYRGGFLLHTGLPNAGVKRVIKKYSPIWVDSPVPILVHLIASDTNDVMYSAEALEGAAGVAGIELGLHDEATPAQVGQLIEAARKRCQLPLLVKLPLYHARYLAQAAEDAGADALVVASPPRGTERDAQSGRLVGGRVYGPWLKAQVLRAVGQLVPHAAIPVIACGGIHSADDARDYVDAGATAVQIDTLTWTHPSQVEIIARNLGGLELTRRMGALADEWEPGIGKTRLMSSYPPNLPEFPFGDDDTSTDP